jgi:hypothetical protein
MRRTGNRGSPHDLTPALHIALTKRGGVYWYKFMWQCKLVRESTKQGNDKVARQMESAHRTSLAKGEVGLRDKKAAPTLSEFIEGRFEPWARSRFQKSSPKTWGAYYRVGLSSIKGYKPLAGLRLDAVTSEIVANFAAHRQAAGMQISSVNSSLQVLRRALRLAVEWGVAEVRARGQNASRRTPSGTRHYPARRGTLLGMCS